MSSSPKDNLLQKLASIEEKVKEISSSLEDPDVLSKPDKITSLSKELKRLQPLSEKAQAYKGILKIIKEATAILDSSSDQELTELAKEDLDESLQKQEALVNEIQILLVPKDSRDEKNAIVEIRAGTGGEEAALFAGDLYRMYSKFIEYAGWKKEILGSNPTGLGGFKEIFFSVSGQDAFGVLKFESGVHRVQRVPSTETSGRIHTSAASVVVLPEVEEVEIDIHANDLRVDVYRSSGPGGQSVNTTDSAVRITHIPTGIVVTCQDEKSQHKNKSKAMRVLRARLFDTKRKEDEAKVAASRRSMIGSGDRSAKIRTYNYPQGRVTDHRINLTLYKLQEILAGDLKELIDKLQITERDIHLKVM